MAPHGSNPLFSHFTQGVRVEINSDPEALAQERLNNPDSRDPGVLGWLSHEVFRRDCLDRKLERHHITGIAFSGAVGIGIFTIPGEVTAPLIDFPHTFVDEALGFTVGIMYWLANCMSMVTLTIAAAMFTQYWPSNFGMTSATFVLLLALFFMNACGVQLYGRMEWVFKWLKIALLLGSCVLMILIRAGVGSGKVDSNYVISPGYKSTGFLAGDKAAIGGTGGRILTVWTCTTMAMFQFMGGEIALVTSGEAKRPMRDLPIAARYMYLLPVAFYWVAILFVGLNVNYFDPRIYHSHIENVGESRLKGLQTAARSPFVIAIESAGIKALPGFLDACFLFSALTAANSALYVSSRTLFTLAQRSSFLSIRKTIGRTNNGHTPLAAITMSFIPGALAFLGVRAGERAFQEPIHVFGRLYTGPVLCIYAAECLAFLRFLAAHYRAHWQPLWAILGLTLCTLLMVFSGWAAIYDLCAKSPGVDWRDSVVDLVASYLGQLGEPPLLFFVVLISYKFAKGTTIRSMSDMRDVWFVRDVPDETDDPPKRRKRPNRFYEFLSWVK
ncbi:MAG: hypothetical protein Q9218_006857 [Villophora microphyllina]